ncbi:pentatricopeptide repeat-containing protein [Bosea sp. UNC402CLCol]|uniref:pentatricopeptide repeat-containing protein n=1 Tax=Bosea sp. UNC402CLCol TaxID=1510531 RepID=UPI000570412B|nr:pentatricopeptide repeat-containing protein [Bosea sp. UNC402CLCol]
MAETTTPQRIAPGEDALLDELDALEASGQSLIKPGENALLDEIETLEAGGESFTTAPPQETPSTLGKIAKDIGKGITEIPGQVNRGVASAINETSGAMYGLVTQPAVQWVHNNLFDMSGIAPGIVAGTANPLAIPLDTAATPKAESVTGSLVKEVTQFATAYYAGGRLLKAAGMVAAPTVGGAVAQGAGRGALVDMLSFDPYEERLSNMIETHTSIREPVTQFLAARPDDSQALGRLKNAVEGLGIGMAAEGFIHAIKGLKAIRAGNREEALKAFDDMEKSGFKPDEPDLTKDRAPDPQEAPAKPVNDNKADPNANPEAPAKEAPKDSAEASAKVTEETGPKPSNDNAVAPEAPIKVDEKALRESVEMTITEQAYGQGRNLSGIRTDLIENGDDLNAIMSSTQRMYAEEIAKQRGGAEVLTNEMLKAQADTLADIVGTNSTALMQQIGKTAGDLQNLPAAMLMYRDVLTTAYTKLVDIAKIYHDPLGGTGPFKTRQEVTEAFIKNYEIAANIQAYYRGQQTQIARSLNAMKITAKNRKGALTDLDMESVRGAGEDRLRAMAGDIAAAGHQADGTLNAKAVSKVIRGGFAENLVNAVISFRTNGMLSGLTTQSTNVVSSVLTAALRPAEKFLAGASRYSTAEGRAQMVEAGLQYGAMVASVKDGISMAAKAFRLNAPQLDPGRARIENVSYKRPPSEAFNIQNSAVATVADAVGTLVNLPGRMMLSGDEFVKQLVYRSEVRSAAYREALQEGSWKSGDFTNFGQIVSKRLDESVDDVGRAMNPDALEVARESTFTKDLKAATWFGKPTIGEDLQRFAGNHPSMRVVMPFIRTPTNILRFGWDRTPFLNLGRKEYYDAIMGARGVQAQADAKAKFAMGSMLWGGAVALATDGSLTGAGPQDPKQRKLLEATGWRPYSIRYKKEDGSTGYFSFARLDPFAGFLGMAADYTELAGGMDDETMWETAGKGLIATVKQLVSKSYLQGLTEFLDALNNPDRNTEKLAKSLAASFAPNLIAKMGDDPYQREARTAMEAVRRKIPGYSQELDPVRNILGEPVTPPPTIGPAWLSPIVAGVHTGKEQPTTKEWKASPREDVKDEMARLALIGNKGFSPPPTTQDGVDLLDYRSPVTGKTAYDRWLELTGEVKMAGQNIHEMLASEIASRPYQAMMTDGSEEQDEEGSRIGHIKVILGGFRMMAMEQLKKEMPDLAQELLKGQIARARALVQQPKQN